MPNHSRWASPRSGRRSVPDPCHLGAPRAHPKAADGTSYRYGSFFGTTNGCKLGQIGMYEVQLLIVFVWARKKMWVSVDLQRLAGCRYAHRNSILTSVLAGVGNLFWPTTKLCVRILFKMFHFFYLRNWQSQAKGRPLDHYSLPELGSCCLKSQISDLPQKMPDSSIYFCTILIWT